MYIFLPKQICAYAWHFYLTYLLQSYVLWIHKVNHKHVFSYLQNIIKQVLFSYSAKRLRNYDVLFLGKNWNYISVFKKMVCLMIYINCWLLIIAVNIHLFVWIIDGILLVNFRIALLVFEHALMYWLSMLH